MALYTARVSQTITARACKSGRASSTSPSSWTADCLNYVGKPLPTEYSADLSLFVLEAGIRILEREHPDLMYSNSWQLESQRTN